MPQTATIKSLPAAFRMMKAMQAEGVEWWRRLSRQRPRGCGASSGIELAVPRTRTFSALKVVRAYARRMKDVDRMILACFLLVLSTRKVTIALLPGRPVSPATVSAVAKQLDAAVAAIALLAGNPSVHLQPPRCLT